MSVTPVNGNTEVQAPDPAANQKSAASSRQKQLRSTRRYGYAEPSSKGTANRLFR